MSSITEVARRAGVSIATASRVVAEVDYPVSPATRARVLEAARALDYVPNALARGLQKSRIPVVGVIVHDITDPYFSEVVRGVEDAAAKGGYLVITCSSDRDPRREASYVRLLRSMRASAVIFAGSGIDDPELTEELARHFAGLRANGGAVVHLSPYADGTPEVGVQNEDGAAAMIDALVQMGHHQIAYLAAPRQLFFARERLAGYRRGMKAAGLEVDERLVVHRGLDAAAGVKGVDALLDGGMGFTALFCSTDLVALGAMRRLRELGISVPGQVSVAGFDDISFAEMTSPRLSTVRLPMRELGARGFAHAVNLMAGKTLMAETLPHEVVLRDSTAPPPHTPARS
ncbi:MAG TPA: LacI family DNA-binding transcriptional regulator [Candidatus Limnocylindrales bacterium]|nr:LacI family DNA-binding transcriptional regulator [Candidatus Limnocylindrales bacterium]